jgi:hypothetical protein
MFYEAVELEAYPHLTKSLIETHLVNHPRLFMFACKLRKTEKENSNEEKQVNFFEMGCLLRR